MKSLCVSIALLCGFGSATAQSGFYLKASGGWGGTWARSVFFTGTTTSDVAKNAYHAAISGGWQCGRWSIESGVGLSQTGGAHRYALLFEHNIDSKGNIVGGTPTEATYTLLHRHYTVPVSVGYSIPFAERWVLQPRLGAEAAYNASAIDRSQIGSEVSTRELQGAQYRRFYHQYALFGSAAVQVHHRLSPRVNIFGGISYRRALTNLLQVPAWSRAPATVHTASATVDAGVLFFLGRGTERPKHISNAASEEG